MRAPKRAIAVVALALAACGGPEASTGPGGGDEHEAEGSSAESIAFGIALAQIGGHHAVAAELFAAGDVAAAAEHALHPVDEVLPAVQHELEEHDPAAAEELVAAVRSAVSATDAAGLGDVSSATERALEAVVGDDASSPAFRGSVIAGLLAAGAHEYEESVSGNKVVEPGEYQDAYGFVAHSRTLYEAVAGEVEAASAEEAAEIEEAYEALGAALPGPRPPTPAAPAADVEAAAKLIGHELEETVGATIPQTQEPGEVVERIEHLLDEIVEHYEAGEPEEAAELAAEAYLENYEVIEARVIESAPEVNEELEPLLGAALRERISEDAPVAEIEEMVARARTLLGEALAAVGEES